MLSINEVNKRTPRCNRCGCFVDLVWIEDPEIRKAVFEIKKSNKSIQFIAKLREITKCSLGEGKATLIHSTSRISGCIRCEKKFEEIGILDCSSCGALNLVWQ